jgi:hypothetical protein
MILESKIFRRIVSMMVIGAIPELIISYIAARYINEGMIWMLFIYLGIQGLYLAVWIVRSAIGWLFYWLVERKKGIKHLCDFLIEAKFPVPENDPYLDGKGYLMSVVGNEKNDTETRIRAAYELGSLQVWSNMGMTQQAMMLLLSFEGAIKEYRSFLIRRQND